MRSDIHTFSCFKRTLFRKIVCVFVGYTSPMTYANFTAALFTETNISLKHKLKFTSLPRIFYNKFSQSE